MSVLSECRIRLAENDLAFAVADRYPLAPGHALICTKREVASWFDATTEERMALLSLGAEIWRRLDKDFSPPGYVLMVNGGTAQHIPHLHVHLIPYYSLAPGGPLGSV